MSEMDENATVILVVLFDPVVKFLDMPLIEKTQYLLLELSAAFAGDDFDKGYFLVNGFFDDAVEFLVDLVAFVVDVVEVEF